MSNILIVVVVAAVASVGSASFFYFLSKKQKPEEVSDNKFVKPDVSKQSVVLEARNKANEIVMEAKNKALRIQQDAQSKVSKVKEESLEVEKKLSAEKAEINTLEKQLGAQRKDLDNLKHSLSKKKESLDRSVKETQQKLEKIAGLSKEQAKKQLLESFDKELVQEKGARVRQLEEEIKAESEEKAREIVVYAMKQAANDYVVEYSSSKVKLPDEEMKGRIIGKEGRNIRKFEELTGVELDLDSTPGEILISSFDPVRREVARVSLEKLLSDGRIQPARIEEIVSKVTGDVEKMIHKEGDNLCHRLGIYNLPKQLVTELGKFKFRFSYGQNMIEHTLEVTKIGIAIASEVGANLETVKLGCLFHDIGKVLEGEGSHVQLGVDFLTKLKVKKQIVDCVEQHHEDKPFSSVESVIVHLADHISGSRPSARSEDYESYVKRLKELEDAAYSFDGVEKVYAISAGREVRVFVKPESVDDASTALLAREIARKIELEQTYPGVVKVTVIRETRVSETAK